MCTYNGTLRYSNTLFLGYKWGWNLGWVKPMPFRQVAKYFYNKVTFPWYLRSRRLIKWCPTYFLFGALSFYCIMCVYIYIYLLILFIYLNRHHLNCHGKYGFATFHEMYHIWVNVSLACCVFIHDTDSGCKYKSHNLWLQVLARQESLYRIQFWTLARGIFPVSQSELPRLGRNN